MTLSDTDLAAGLRDLRGLADDIPPAPRDLAQTARDRHRRERRSRIAAASVGLAVLLVLGAVPVIDATLVRDGDRGEVATPGKPTRVPPPHLADLPTRGSLADDEAWLDEVEELDWRPQNWSDASPEELAILADVLPDPPVGTRQVAYADDVPGARVALVLGDDEDHGWTYAWFVGPEGAEPSQMDLATQPGIVGSREPLALWDAPDPDSDDGLFVVVTFPGDEARLLTGRTVSAGGETEPVWADVPLADGAGALVVRRPLTWFGESAWVRDDGRREHPELRAVSDRALSRTAEPIAVADPRRLLGAVDGEQVQWAALSLMEYFGLPAEDLDPTLLAVGPVSDGSGMMSLLVGVTLPSGATAAYLGRYLPGDNSIGGWSMITRPAPAGSPLLERVFAVPSPGSLTVSGPADGVLAEVFLEDGSFLASIPLVEGAGIGPVPPPAPTFVRVLDASGAVLAEGTLSRGADG